MSAATEYDRFQQQLVFPTYHMFAQHFVLWYVFDGNLQDTKRTLVNTF